MARPKGKILHPSSRKVKQKIARKHHGIKVAKRKKMRRSKDELKRTKMLWFKENIPQNRTSLTVDDLRSLIFRYLRRSKLDSKEEERETENCSISMTIDMTNELLKQETQEFVTTGLLVPDLTSKQNLEKFMNWNGEVDRMASIPLIHVKKV
ncbi:expressed conserved protein [Echinococcus multilocularis]|uniref:Expressed conserved protein n=1 Tax=Echinococcus multilocularis TaxID=6211 RepID=A0A068Y2H4_ECHMU|nr:expressed conserved protein [Echinococcus multilocularis]